MEKIIEYLKGVFFVATTEGDQPRVRPFDSVVAYDGKIYFETTQNKNVYRQLVENPKIEIFCLNESGSLRLTGVARAETDDNKKQEVIKMIGKYMDNPMLAVFSIGDAEAVITNTAGETETVRL